MSHQTLFYIFGIALVCAALITAAIGLRMPSFPPNGGVLIAVVAVFGALVVGTAVFGVLNAQDEQADRAAEQAAETTSTTASTTTASTSSTSSSTTPSSTSSSTSTSTTAAGGAGGTIKVSADPTGQLAFEQKQLTTKAGDVTIDFTNQSPVGHDVHVEDSSGKDLGGTDVITGGSDSASVTLAKGTYTFFCSVPGHEEAGMKGTLTVK